MKVNSALQVNWQAVANKKQQQLEAATKGKMLKDIREAQQFEIYKTKGKKLEIETVFLARQVNIQI